MKILMLSEYPYSDYEHALGGIMQATYQLVEGICELKDKDLELHIITTSPRCKSVTTYEKNNIFLHYIPRTEYIFFEIFVTPIRLLFYIFLLNKKLHFSLIHGQGTATYILLSFLLGKKSVQTIHGIYRNEQLAIPRKDQSLMTKVKFFLKRNLENYYLLRVKNIIAATNEIVNLLASVGNSNVKILRINNAIDIKFFKDKKLSGTTALTDDFSSPVKLLFVAAITPRKGLHVLLHSFKSIADKYPQAILKIAGIWDWAPLYIKEQMIIYNDLIVAGRIEFTGGIETEPLIDLYRTSDIFVLPSFAESAPMVISQALCAGLPVVSTQVGGIPEMVENGVTGFLVEPDNVGALTEALSLLIENPRLRKEMGIAARSVGFSRYHPQSIAAATLSAYKQIILN